MIHDTMLLAGRPVGKRFKAKILSQGDTYISSLDRILLGMDAFLTI